MPEAHKIEHPSIRRYVIMLAVLWTVIVGAAFYWNVTQEMSNVRKAVLIQARVAIQKDILYRRWNALSGGVYAAVSEMTPPNPYLEWLPERDIVTPSGRLLTLVNPSYMTRQVHELAEIDHGEEGHISSLNPTNPANAPDAWEREALTAFEQGETEKSIIEKYDDHIHARLMKPLVTEEPCLQCHAAQGNEVGDIQGGLSVRVRLPAEELFADADAELQKQGLGYALIWLAGLGGIFVAAQRLRRSERERVRGEAKIAQSNSELTVLYEVSAVVSQEIELDSLLKRVLDTITGLSPFNFENKGGIFIVDGERLKLKVSKGHDKEFLDLHREMVLGECLCGLAAQTGEIITSSDSHEDDRHTITYPGMSSHGHVIVPLVDADNILGVLYLYVPAGTGVSKADIELLTAIGSQLGTAVGKARLYEETRSLALHDPLTGLANRNLMTVEIERTYSVAKRYGTPYSLVMLDLDHFKSFNDTYGHIVGDALLRRIAEIITGEVRDVDLAVRYGGEEFLIILSKAGLDSAVEIAERIRRRTETADFAEEGAKPVKITVSLGVASWDESIASGDELLSRADTALYKAKGNGRNRVEVWPA